MSVTTDEMRDEAIRNYLIFLDNPEDLRDAEAISAKQQELASATDPLNRLHLHDELVSLRDLPETRFQAPFIANALEYAEHHGVSVAGFESLGVSRSVLREAGFDVQHPNKGISVLTVIEMVLEKDWTEFTKPAAQILTGSSPVTITKAINEMMKADQITLTDRTTTGTGRGARAKVYTIKR